MISSLICLALAITCLYVAYNYHIEIVQLAAGLSALFCAGLSIVFSPVPVEVTLCIAFLFTTSKINNC